MPASSLKAEIESRLESSWFDIPIDASAEADIDVACTVIDHRINSAAVDGHSAVAIVHFDAKSVSFALSCEIAFEVDVETTFVAGDTGISRRIAIAETTLTQAISTSASAIVSATFVRDRFGKFYFEIKEVDLDTGGSPHVDFGYLDLHEYLR